MVETRKEQRRHTPFYLKVFEKGTHQFTGSLADLTVGGMKLFSWQPMDTGTTFECELILPDESCGRKQIELSARCMWRKRHVKPDMDFYEVGFELLDVSPENRQTIENALQKFFFKSEQVSPVGEKLNTVAE